MDPDPLEFEFVSLSEAKEAASQAEAKIAVNGGPKAAATERDWTKTRKQQVAFDLALQQETAKWVLRAPRITVFSLI